MGTEIKQRILRVCGHCYRPLENNKFHKGARICKECSTKMRKDRAERCRVQMKNPDHPSHGSANFAKAGCQCEDCRAKMREIQNRDNKTRRARRAKTRIAKAQKETKEHG